MKLTLPFIRKPSTKPPVTDMLKQLKEENRKAAVSARITVAQSGAEALSNFLNSVPAKKMGS